MGARLSETELQKSLDFCLNLFNPTSPEQHERLSRRADIARDLLDVSSSVVDPSLLNGTPCIGHDHCAHFNKDSSNSSECEEELETKMILDKINARRVIHPEYAINNLELEPLTGYVVKLERGDLGLKQASL